MGYSITGASHRPGTSKQLTLCLTYNEPLLESHVGGNEGGAEREVVKREENVKYLYNWIQKTGNIINGQKCSHMCSVFYFLFWQHTVVPFTSDTMNLLTCIFHIFLSPAYCSFNFQIFQQHWSWCFQATRPPATITIYQHVSVKMNFSRWFLK